MTFFQPRAAGLGAAIALMLGAAGAQTAEDIAAMSATLLVDTPGKAVNVEPFLPSELPEIPYERLVLPGPQFLFSDEPEYIRVPEGVAMRERVEPGTVRLYVYNVNGVREPNEMPRRVTAVIKNLGDDPLRLRFLRYSTQPPSGNYHRIGKEGLRDFFSSEPQREVRTIPVGGAMALDPELEARVLQFNDLAHGFYEFVIDQPAEVSVLQTDPETSGVEANERLTEILPVVRQRNAGRGLFGVSNYRITAAEDFVLSTEGGIQQITVADNNFDPWVRGIESGTGDAIELRGNYGVVYDIHLDYVTPDGRGLALVTWNSRWESSQWCGGLAASVEVSAGLFDAGVVEIPSNQLVLRRPPEVGVIQIFPPVPEGETGQIHVRFSPPGASCLPMPLIFVPVDLPDGD